MRRPRWVSGTSELFGWDQQVGPFVAACMARDIAGRSQFSNRQTVEKQQLDLGYPALVALTKLMA